MLFKDQCVYSVTMAAYIETEEQITSYGYKVFVGGSAVTEMRVFVNKGSVNAVINIENLIEFPNDMFFAYLGSYGGAGVYSVPSPTKNASVKLYKIVYNKLTGDTVETELGNVAMNKIVNGKFGNYFPKQMLDQSTSKLVMLTNKYSYGGRVLITKKSYDVLTFYTIASVSVRILDMNENQIGTALLSADNMYIVSLNCAAWGLNKREYQVVFESGGSELFRYEVYVSSYIDGLPQRRGTQYSDDGEKRFNLFFHHPWGGLDHIGNVNASSINGETNRQQVRVQDTAYIHGGSANSFETTTQSPNVFSTSTLPVTSEGKFSQSYEGYVSNVNELWIAAISASKVGYLVSDSQDIKTIIDVEITGVSASIETLENGDKLWKISVSATQKIPFVS